MRVFDWELQIDLECFVAYFLYHCGWDFYLQVFVLESPFDGLSSASTSVKEMHMHLSEAIQVLGLKFPNVRGGDQLRHMAIESSALIRTTP